MTAPSWLLMTAPSWSAMTDDMYCAVAAVRAVAGLPPVPATDPAAIAATCDPKIQRLPAAIKREVDRSPTLRPDQTEKLRGLLPYPYADDDSTLSKQKDRIAALLRPVSASSDLPPAA